MKMLNVFSKLFLAGLLNLTLLSCVGTIDESPSKTVSVPAKSEKLTFKGIDSCNAISDTKIEVLFKEAKIEFGTVTTEELIYQVFLDGAFDQASSSGKASELLLDGDDKYHILVKNLDAATKYTLTVRVRDPLTGQADANVITCEAKTDDVEKPDFTGLKSLTPFPGIDGNDSAYLSWNEAIAGKFVFDGLPYPDYRIHKYTVYKGDTADNLIFYKDIFIKASDNPGGVFPSDVILNSAGHPANLKVVGLNQGQSYFFKINASDESGRQERNEIVRSIELSQLTEITFDGVSEVNTIHADEGEYTLDVKWPIASGLFDIYRIYKMPATNSLKSVDPLSDEYLHLVTDDVTKVALSLQGPGENGVSLTKDSEYKVYVVACKKSNDNPEECAPSPSPMGHDKYKTGTTSPNLRAFGGISKIEQPEGVDGLNRLNISWNPPSTEGVCDEIIVKDAQLDTVLTKCTGGSDICLEKSPTCDSTGVIVRNMQGSEYLNKAKCFKAYVQSGSRTTDSDKLVTKCGTIKMVYPIFQGNFLRCNALSADTIQLEWDTPNPVGIKDDYLVFYKHQTPDTAGNSNNTIEDGVDFAAFGKASLQGVQTLNAGTANSKLITGLSSGQKYSFMVKAVAYKTNTGLDADEYDENTLLVNCTTNEETLEFDGWNYIGGFGPTQGPFATEPEIEIINNLSATPEGKVTGFSTTSTDSSGLGLGREGNIVVAFNDMEFSNGETLNSRATFEQVDSSATSSDLGYYDLVADTDGYYLFYNENFDISKNKEVEINFIDDNSNSWKPAIVDSNGDPKPSRLNTDKGFVTIVHSLKNLHPRLISANSEVKVQNRGKILSYALRAKIGNQWVKMDGTKGKNAIFEVIIPPANMVMIHPWMINKDHCERLSLTPDPLNNYRCETTGPGTNEDPLDSTKSYFEQGTFSLIDKNDLNCKGTGGTDLAFDTEPSTSSTGQKTCTVYLGAGKTDPIELASRSDLISIYIDGDEYLLSFTHRNSWNQADWDQGKISGNIRYFPKSHDSIDDSNLGTMSFYYSGLSNDNWNDVGTHFVTWFEPSLSTPFLQTSGVPRPCGSSVVKNPEVISQVGITCNSSCTEAPNNKNISYSLSDIEADLPQDDPATPAGSCGANAQKGFAFQISSTATNGYGRDYSEGTGVIINFSKKADFIGGNTIGSKVDELYPGFSGDLAGGKWMRNNTAVFPSPIAGEYHFRNYPINSGDPVFNIADAVIPWSSGDTSSDLGLTYSQAHYMCKAKPISIQLSSLNSDFSKPIRKRLITSKEANFARASYLTGGIPTGTPLNDQALCTDDALGNYVCNPYVALTSSLIVDWNNTNLATDYGVRYPFTASLTDPIIPDQTIYITNEGTSQSFSYVSTEIGIGAKWASFSATKDDAPYSDMTWMTPTTVAENIRCAVQIELDYIGGGIKNVDGR